MSVVWPALPALLLGARNTLMYCLVAFPLALLLGMVLALMDGARSVWLSGPARIFIEVIRGTPIVAQIFLVYYGLGALLANANPVWVSWINVWTAGIGTLVLNYAAYEAETYRAGFLSVEKGQAEAALSLGLTASQNFFRIQLPQAVPLMIPPFVNDFIYMLKDSAVVSLIAGTDLTATLQYYVMNNTSNSFPFYLVVIVLYLIMSLPVSYLAKWLERRLRAAL